MKIGTDIVDIARIEKILSHRGEAFLKRFLHPEEIGMIRKVETAAGFWAAKEAVAKALGCGIGKSLSFHDIIISKDKNGAPSFQLSKEAQKRHPYTESTLSISHDAGIAIATVIVI